MLLLSLDFETTGLDRNSDRITEVGAVLYSTTRKHPLMTKGYLVETDVAISKEITNITGVTKGMVEKFGLSSRTALEEVLNLVDMSEAIIGQNIVEFDMPFLRNWAEREKMEVPERLVIDIKTDLPGVEPKHLGYMAADAGFLNPFPHQAISDCMTVLKLVDQHDIDQVVARAKSPRVTVQALVTFDNNQQAKKRKYQWNPDRKIWYRTMKEVDLETETKEAPFNIQRVAPVPFH